MVEAVGVDPTSEKRDLKASTCVAFDSGSRPWRLGRKRSDARASLAPDPDGEARRAAIL